MKILKSIVLSLMAFILIASPVLAISYPDTYTFDSMQAFQLEDGSQVYLITFTILDGTPPTETASEAWMFRMSDALVPIAETVPVDYVDSGYTSGCIGIYFNFDDTDLPVWAVAAIAVNMTGNPSLIWDEGAPPIRPNNLVDSWNVGGDLLSARIRAIALSLETPFTLDLIELINGVYRLTPEGEEYFEAAIPNLRAIAPDLFSALTSVPQVIDHTYTGTYATTVENTWAGATVFGNFDTLATSWGISRMWLLSGLWTALCGTIGVVLAINMKTARGASFLFGALMVIGASMGFFSFVGGILIGIIGFFAIVWAILWKGAA